MKRYNGNVSFVMNINSVDVTPSRESVIWNTKTREAIKGMFVKAQNTILDIIQEKIKDASCLSDHLNMLDTFKNKNAVTGLSELYKVIDVAELDLKFKTFSLEKAAIDLKDEKKFVFTSTGKTNSWSFGSIKDTDYTSNLSKKYLSYLSILNNNFKCTIVYIGKTKYKDLARYVKSKFISDLIENVNIVFFREEEFEETEKLIGINSKKKDFKKLSSFINTAYKEKNQKNIVYGEVFLAISKGMNVLYEEEIDKSEMKKLGEVAEQTQKNVYMSVAEKAKLENKVSCYHFKGTYKQKNYYNEANIEAYIISGIRVVLYKLKDPINEVLTTERYRINTNVLSNYIILGVSDENFKRFIKIKGVKILSDIIYSIEFGDIKITKIGLELLDSHIINGITSKEESLKETVFKFLVGTYTDIKLDKNDIDKKVNDIVINLKRHRVRIQQQKIIDEKINRNKMPQLII